MFLFFIFLKAFRCIIIYRNKEVEKKVVEKSSFTTLQTRIANPVPGLKLENTVFK
jgi:hypothetical protein